MGGAPSLADHLQNVTADLYISTNAHGVALRKPDYLLAMDENHSTKGRDMGAYLHAQSEAPIVSPHPFADYQMATWPQKPRFVLSGMIAAWVAYMMGAKVVILAGMDAYGGDPGYVGEARKIARDIMCPVRVAGGGPLEAVWPAYDRGERFGRYKEYTDIRRWLGVDERVRIRVRKSCWVRGAERAPGYETMLMRHEVTDQLHHRMIEEVQWP